MAIKITEKEKGWIEAIVKDPKLGRGSCSSISECFDDEEFAAAFREEGVESEEDALNWAYESEGLWREKGLGIVSQSGEEVDEFWKEEFHREKPKKGDSQDG